MLTILCYRVSFSFFLLIINLYFLATGVIAKTFIPRAELAITIGISTKDAISEIETYPLTVEAKISKCSI